MPEKIRKCCKRCGSENVFVDATARWSVEAQQWEISGLLDNSDCDDCGRETDIVDRTEIEDAA